MKAEIDERLGWIALWRLQIILLFMLGILAFIAFVASTVYYTSLEGKAIFLLGVTGVSIVLIICLIRVTRQLADKQTIFYVKEIDPTKPLPQFKLGGPNAEGYLAVCLTTAAIFFVTICAAIIRISFRPESGDAVVLGIAIFFVLAVWPYGLIMGLSAIIANKLDKRALETVREAKERLRPNWLFLGSLTVFLFCLYMIFVNWICWSLAEGLVRFCAIPQDRPTIDLIDEINKYPSYRSYDRKVIKSYIKRGANINVQAGLTPLSMAASAGDVAFVEELLAMGANPDGVDTALGGGNPAIVEAVRYPGVIQILLDHGANINIVSHSGVRNALLNAVQEDQPKTLQLLIDKGADINKQCADGQTPLSIAGTKVDPEMFDMLLKAGAKINKSESYNTLTYAARSGDADRVNRLVQMGASINPKGKSGLFGLWYAIESNNPAVVKVFVDMGVDVNSRIPVQGYTSFLEHAKYIGNGQVIDLLEKSGAHY